MPPPTISIKSNGSVETGSDNKNVAGAFCSPQSKTPRKSGLTPIHPGKSPGTGMKLKSGLTPVRPGTHHGQPKSPFFTKPKLKSGLLPIKPNWQAQSTVSDLNSSSLNARRKSGLLPIKPVGSVGSGLASQKSGDFTVSRPFSFTLPNQGGMSNESAPQNGSRRKSGLLPIKKGIGAVARDRQFHNRPVPSIAISNHVESSPVFRSLTHVQRTKTVEATPILKSITEDRESPLNSRSNISGLAPLDDTVNMSVVIRPRPGHRGSSRIPLPRSTLDPAHFSSSDSTISSNFKRVLHFPDEDVTARNCGNVLKDGSSKVNTMEEPITSSRITHPPEAVVLASDPKAVSIGKEKAVLLKRKEEIEGMLKEMSAELEQIKENLKVLEEKEDETVNESENLAKLKMPDDSESDSPFGHVSSPLTAAPLELLTLDKSKQPENIYKVFRQSCSFLKTPQPSAFRKPNGTMRFTQQSKTIDDSPNVSHRLQKQLADLFDE